jgi:predicted RNA-binding protein YlxR (DUF448 family)
MARKKHKPQRTCIACREARNKRDLIRVVRTPTGNIVVDPTGKANGRGAYLCRNSECWQTGLERGRLAKALKATITPEVLATLQTELLKA